MVVSVFGCMFAPRHAVAAAELARALRPGGRLAVAAWTPDGSIGELFRTMGGYMPPPPDFAQPPLLWGTEDHVRGLFEDTGVEVEFMRETIEFPPFASIEEEMDYATSKLGPLVMARGFLEPQGRWEPLLADLRAVLERQRPAEYLVTLGRKAS